MAGRSFHAPRNRAGPSTVGGARTGPDAAPRTAVPEIGSTADAAPRRVERGDYGVGRARQLSLRVTEPEDEEIRSRAAAVGLGKAEFLRRAALATDWRPLGAEAAAKLGQLHTQLRLAGNNLNQLTRMAHLAGLGDGPRAGLGSDIGEAVEEVRRLGRRLEEALGELAGEDAARTAKPAAGAKRGSR